MFSSQLASSSSAKSQFSFEIQPHPIDAPRLDRKGGALLNHRHNFISGHVPSRCKALGRRPTELSGTTAADSVNPRDTFTTAESIKRRLSLKAHLLDTRSINSMVAEYHCDEEYEGVQITEPGSSVDYKESVNSEESLYGKRDLDYKDNRKVMGEIEGTIFIPPFDFEAGFDKPDGRDIVSQSIVV